MSPKISIILVTYNSGPLTLLCLWSLRRAGLTDSEVIVVDNAGDDEIPDVLQREFPFIRLIKNTTNQGFGRACNLGMEVARGEFFLLLNPDTIVPRDFEQAILRFFDEHPGTGAMGVKMIGGQGNFLPESKRNLPTPSASLYRFTGLTHLFPHSPRFASYYAGDLSSSREGIVEVLSGAFMAISRQAIQKAGAFDPQFFLYGEDIDLSWRIHQAGFQTWYNPAIEIIHFKGESTTKSPRQARIFYKAMRQFYRKHFTQRYSPLVSVTVLAAIEGLTVLATVKHLFTGKQSMKMPAAFCLTGDSCLENITHLNDKLPFTFILPKTATKEKLPKALLLNTHSVGPDELIKRAQQYHKRDLQLFIYHPDTSHLFLVANHQKRSQTFKI